MTMSTNCRNTVEILYQNWVDRDKLEFFATIPDTFYVSDLSAQELKSLCITGSGFVAKMRAGGLLRQTGETKEVMIPMYGNYYKKVKVYQWTKTKRGKQVDELIKRLDSLSEFLLQTYEN